MNNPTLGEFCFTMIGRADIEGSKSNVAMNAWLPQASYPCGTHIPAKHRSPPRFPDFSISFFWAPFSWGVDYILRFQKHIYLFVTQPLLSLWTFLSIRGFAADYPLLHLRRLSLYPFTRPPSSRLDGLVPRSFRTFQQFKGFACNSP